MLVQGRGSRSELLNQFRADGNAILLGTGSFWQGVDVRGRALRLVMIDKLPFAVPSDPLVQARAEAIRRAGGDAFNELQLPQAVLALKQGVGRLIRDFDDRGLIVLGDPRLRTRDYGATFLASLPAMPVHRRPRRGARVRGEPRRRPVVPARARGRVMKLLGFETSSTVGSVALETPASVLVREIATPREQTEQLLALIDELLRAAGIGLQDLDGIAFGRGPGSFTGLRVSVAVAQGLAAVERRAAAARVELAVPRASALGAEHGCERALVCVDAHMGEVYWAAVERARRRRVGIVGDERLGAPGDVARAGAAAVVRRRQRVRGASPRRSASERAAPRERLCPTLKPVGRGLVPPGRSAISRPGASATPAAALPVYLREHTAWRRSS